MLIIKYLITKLADFQIFKLLSIFFLLIKTYFCSPKYYLFIHWEVPDEDFWALQGYLLNTDVDLTN